MFLLFFSRQVTRNGGGEYVKVNLTCLCFVSCLCVVSFSGVSAFYTSSSLSRQFCLSSILIFISKRLKLKCCNRNSSRNTLTVVAYFNAALVTNGNHRHRLTSTGSSDWKGANREFPVHWIIIGHLTAHTCLNGTGLQWMIMLMKLKPLAHNTHSY